MCDAEIAAVLLNRCAVQPVDEGEPIYLGVLREGNLSFKRELGFVGARDVPDIKACRTESLIFDDGSRALRISVEESEGGWTRWTALQPLH
ncbi:hypothetical protein [Paraburkholderia rhynchosiae]|uniref:Uncharacterized protein n=1 Tax=Paraburkholderia rhynchosiae TaxID=487049 RepID=A0A2N7WML1_9BURK|nr:hypothetical protein [Paraburkholderia rhynchosiae]PMS30679.1 hypothetical protein C0Z16_14105 [Paraburkholderia rhynchosiae]CAB3686349.1 hypothetical protein LMG27174_02929 [Paraburkholderia rhynchosiae]